MNREQIIQMAREAGFDVDEADFIFAPLTKRTGIHLEIERLCNIVRAATKEEDAKICENLDAYYEYDPGESFSAAIRASK